MKICVARLGPVSKDRKAQRWSTVALVAMSLVTQKFYLSITVAFVILIGLRFSPAITKDATKRKTRDGDVD